MTPHGIRYTPSTAQVLKELDGWTHLIQWFASLLLDLIIYSLIYQGCFYPLWWPSHLLLLVIHLFLSVLDHLSVFFFLFLMSKLFLTCGTASVSGEMIFRTSMNSAWGLLTSSWFSPFQVPQTWSFQFLQSDFLLLSCSALHCFSHLQLNSLD